MSVYQVISQEQVSNACYLCLEEKSSGGRTWVAHPHMATGDPIHCMHLKCLRSWAAVQNSCPECLVQSDLTQLPSPGLRGKIGYYLKAHHRSLFVNTVVGMPVYPVCVVAGAAFGAYVGQLLTEIGVEMLGRAGARVLAEQSVGIMIVTGLFGAWLGRNVAPAVVEQGGSIVEQTSIGAYCIQKIDSMADWLLRE